MDIIASSWRRTAGITNRIEHKEKRLQIGVETTRQHPGAAAYHGRTRFSGAAPRAMSKLQDGLHHIGGALLWDKVTGACATGPRALTVNPLPQRGFSTPGAGDRHGA
jgi:hypothetical protein